MLDSPPSPTTVWCKSNPPVSPRTVSPVEVATGKHSPWELDGQNRSEPVVRVSHSKAQKNRPCGARLPQLLLPLLCCGHVRPHLRCAFPEHTHGDKAPHQTLGIAPNDALNASNASICYGIASITTAPAAPNGTLDPRRLTFVPDSGAFDSSQNPLQPTTFTPHHLHPSLGP